MAEDNKFPMESDSESDSESGSERERDNEQFQDDTCVCKIFGCSLICSFRSDKTKRPDLIFLILMTIFWLLLVCFLREHDTNIYLMPLNQVIRCVILVYATKKCIEYIIYPNKLPYNQR